MKARKTNPVSVRRIVGYVRVSLDDQGISLEAQEAKIGAYCVAMDWPVSEVIRDPGRSARTLERPGIGNLLAQVRRGEIERIIVAKLDRLTRSMKDLAELLDLFAKTGTALVSIGETLDTSTAAGRMVTNMLGVLAQWERETCAERTSGALSHKRQQRQAYGRTPFGFVRVGDALEEHSEEQLIKGLAVTMDKAGSSFREIGAMLRARTGRSWGPSSVRAMLRSRIVVEAVA